MNDPIIIWIVVGVLLVLVVALLLSVAGALCAGALETFA